ncbi:MAG: hypothetical protein QOC96_2553 [Acidobacteriota bacterium]|jgi:hypothetical protein|nr:hypothetical protein [Acidobacteriota bacterium]
MNMDEAEAQLVLAQELSHYRNYSYTKLLSLIDDSKTFERTSPSGIKYQIEIQVFFDDIKAKRDLRVLGAIDGGGISAFSPLCDDFIMAPDGSFVGE